MFYFTFNVNTFLNDTKSVSNKVLTDRRLGIHGVAADLANWTS